MKRSIMNVRPAHKKKYNDQATRMSIVILARDSKEI